MRIKYDFEDEYKDIDLGEKLTHILSFPKRYIEHKLQSIKKEMEDEEKENKDTCIFIEGIKEDDPAITIKDYSAALKKKIHTLLPEDELIYILQEVEELVIHFRKGL